MACALSGYDYPCHTNLENICMHISTYLRTHTGGSRDTEEEEEEEDAHTLAGVVHTHPQDGLAGAHASCTYTH